MTMVREVMGPPARDANVTITKITAGPPTYDGNINVYSSQLSVLAHEIGHALRGTGGGLLENRVWEEGLARAGEVEVMRLLAAEGIVEPGYDYSHNYTYDRYYDMFNVAGIGTPGGNIYAYYPLQLLRYELAGYAFGKLIQEYPPFIKRFHALLFAQLVAGPSTGQLAAMAALIAPAAEGQPFAGWYAAQHIFDTRPPGGCRLFQRINQWTVDFPCTNQSGTADDPQLGATVALAVHDWSGRRVYSGADVTTSLGWVSLTPPLTGGEGRLRSVATARAPDGSVLTSTQWRQAGGEDGVFGIVTNADGGWVSFSSPARDFTAFSVPVVNGAFAAPSLTSLRGQFVATYSGPGLTVSRTVDKDASPYSLVLTGQKLPPDQSPPPPAPGLPGPSTPPAQTGPTNPPVIVDAPAPTGQIAQTGRGGQAAGDGLTGRSGGYGRARALRLVVAGGSRQSARIRRRFQRRLRVRAGRPDGSTAPGVRVTFAVRPRHAAAFGRRFRAVTVVTDARGLATAPALIAGRKGRRFKVTASAAGYGNAVFALRTRR